MNGFRVFLAVALVTATMLFASTAQAAMPIQVYDRMSDADQTAYLDVMLLGAKQVLTDAGRPDQAAQVEKLFTTVEPGDENSLGMVELELNMSVVRQTDADNLVKNPNAKPVKVEIAMIVTLNKNGIILPRASCMWATTFRARIPCRRHRHSGPFLNASPIGMGLASIINAKIFVPA